MSGRRIAGPLQNSNRARSSQATGKRGRGEEQAEEERKNKEEDQHRANEEARTNAMTEEMDLVMLSTPREEPGVSAGSSEECAIARAAREKEERVAFFAQGNIGPRAFL